MVLAMDVDPDSFNFLSDPGPVTLSQPHLAHRKGETREWLSVKKEESAQA